MPLNELDLWLQARIGQGAAATDLSMPDGFVAAIVMAVRGLQIGMLAEKVRNLGLDRLRQHGTRSMTQDFGELILDVSWLNQLDDVIFGHGISLLRWRCGGVKHPHDMPPFRFPPSPTLGNSSAVIVDLDAELGTSLKARKTGNWHLTHFR